MPTKYNKILKYHHGEKSLKVPFMIYLDLESLLKKMHSYQNDPENSSTEEKAKHEPLAWVMIVKCSFDSTKDKNDYYRGIDCIEKFRKKLKDYAREIINYEEKETIPLADEETRFYKEPEVCHICKKEFFFDKNEKKNLNYTKKSEIIANSLENVEEQLIVFAI